MLSKTEADAAYIYELETQNKRLRAELAAAKKVADAAVGWTVAYTLKMRFIMGEAAGDVSADAAYRAMVGVVFEAQNAFSDAVREYRALTEPPALSPSKQAAVERGIEAAGRIETMQETN